MKSTDININLIESYFGLLKNLSSDMKLELIARLSNSMKTEKKVQTGSDRLTLDSFISEKSADELINELKESRTFTHDRESL